MTKTDQAIADILTRFEELADVHGSEALKLAMKAAQIEAIQTIVTGGLLLVLAVIFGLLTHIASKKCLRMEEQDDFEEHTVWIPRVLGGFAVLIALSVAIGKLASVKTWVGLSDPKLYLAHRILERVL